MGKRGGELTTRLTSGRANKMMRERISEELVKKLEHVEPEKITEPDLRIAVPAIQGLSLSMKNILKRCS